MRKERKLKVGYEDFRERRREREREREVKLIERKKRMSGREGSLTRTRKTRLEPAPFLAGMSIKI